MSFEPTESPSAGGFPGRESEFTDLNNGRRNEGSWSTNKRRKNSEAQGPHPAPGGNCYNASDWHLHEL
jgi:hypothetical protein